MVHTVLGVARIAQGVVIRSDVDGMHGNVLAVCALH